MPDLVSEALLLSRPEYQGGVKVTREHLIALRHFYTDLLRTERVMAKNMLMKKEAV